MHRLLGKKGRGRIVGFRRAPVRNDGPSGCRRPSVRHSRTRNRARVPVHRPGPRAMSPSRRSGEKCAPVGARIEANPVPVSMRHFKSIGYRSCGQTLRSLPGAGVKTSDSPFGQIACLRWRTADRPRRGRDGDQRRRGAVPGCARIADLQHPRTMHAHDPAMSRPSPPSPVTPPVSYAGPCAFGARPTFLKHGTVCR